MGGDICRAARWALVALVWSAAAAVAGEVAYVLDAAHSQVVRVDPAGTEPPAVLFSTPTLVRPEGACGLAYTGYSLWYIDATDPDRLIYEVNPADGTIWNAVPAPSPSVDGLDYADGALLASSYAEDRVYRLDPVDGRVLATLPVAVDLAGGLAAGDGRLFASLVRPGRIYELDPTSGQVIRSFAAPAGIPAGLAWHNGDLLVGDTQGERLLLVDPATGAVVGERALAGRKPAGLAAGTPGGPVPYRLRLSQVDETQTSPTTVTFTLRAEVQTEGGRLLTANRLSLLQVTVAGGQATLGGSDTARVAAGAAEFTVTLPVGQTAEVSVGLSGLETASLRIGAVARAARLTLTLTPDSTATDLLICEARLVDVFGEPVSSDTTLVAFAMTRGYGVVVGPSGVAPSAGRSVTRVRLLRPGATAVVRATQGGCADTAAWIPPATPAGTVGTPGRPVSATAVAGLDELPPPAPRGVTARLNADRVEVAWTLSAGDAAQRWYPVGDQITRLPLVRGYRLLRSLDDGLYLEVAALPSGTDHWSDLLPASAKVARYKVVAEDADNLSETPIQAGSPEDLARTVTVSAAGSGTPVDAEGNPVLGLFGEDLVVGFDDFFLFADHFGQQAGAPAFDPRYDLDGSGTVDFQDFFLFTDYFGRRAVAIR